MAFPLSTGVRRTVWLAVFISTASLLGFGYYLQYVEYLDPCPLCITQRLFYYLIGGAALIAAFRVAASGFQRGMAVVTGLAAIGGIITAGRQVWLQHLPPEKVPECGPGLQYWLDNMPASQTLMLLFKGDGNCAEVHWRFLGLSIGEWSLLWFIGFLVLSLVLLVSRVASAAGPASVGTQSGDPSTDTSI